MIKHALTVDVEDWFHILDCPQTPKLENYTSFESRVVKNTDIILDLLMSRNVKATFFILGWVAETYPDLAKKIASHGHEIAIHGYEHTLANEISDKQLESDTIRAFNTVSEVTGIAPVGYRSPGGSLLPRHRWLFDLLIDLGIKFDSSIYPRNGGLAEEEGFPLKPYPIHQRGENIIWEFPSTTKQFVVNWAFAEGGYLRLLPLWLVRRCFKSFEDNNISVNCCVHPREFDPQQPRLPLSNYKQWKAQVGLESFTSKVTTLLDNYNFCTVGEVLNINSRE